MNPLYLFWGFGDGLMQDLDLQIIKTLRSTAENLPFHKGLILPSHMGMDIHEICNEEKQLNQLEIFSFTNDKRL